VLLLFLHDVQTQFEAMFQSQAGWGGFVGGAPSASTLALELQQRDLFIYFGHGAGEKVLSPLRHTTILCKLC
jgi:hypothetical protein